MMFLSNRTAVAGRIMAHAGLLLSSLMLAGCGDHGDGGRADATAIPTQAANGTSTVPPAIASPSVLPVDPGANEAAMAQAGLGGLAGAWRVVGVRVPGVGVQALATDDPAYMDAVLDMTPQRLAWRAHDGGTLSDVCDAPRLGLDGAIACTTGEFGPPGARLVREGRRLTLSWYDGGTLVLERMDGSGVR